MKKHILILVSIVGFVIQSNAQCNLAHTESSEYEFTVQWEISGNTLYYSMIVNTPSEFVDYPYPTENYVGFRVYDGDAIGVFEIYFDPETFPYGHAEYCGSFDISGHNPASMNVAADLNIVVDDGSGGVIYDDHDVLFALYSFAEIKITFNIEGYFDFTAA